MTEGSISELIKWWIYLLLVFGALALFMFFYQVGQTNRFASFVAAEIERGGVQVEGSVVTLSDDSSDVTQTLSFTPEAEARIRQENESIYDGRYNVDLLNDVEPDEQMGFGDIVDFEVTGDYEILFSWFNAPILKSEDQAIIQTRLAGSQSERDFVQSMFSYEDFVYGIDKTNNVGLVTGFSDNGVDKYNNLESDGLIGDFVVPDKIVNGVSVTDLDETSETYGEELAESSENIAVTQIADDAFSGYSFEGDFIAPNVTYIGQHAFSDADGFNGTFNAPNTIGIGQGAFEDANFTGDFAAESATTIGSRAFAESDFTGTINIPRVQSIGNEAFVNSVFTGSFNAPSVTSVGDNALAQADFEGYFNAPNIEIIGQNAFNNSNFSNGVINGNEFIED